MFIPAYNGGVVGGDNAADGEEIMPSGSGTLLAVASLRDLGLVLRW